MTQPCNATRMCRYAGKPCPHRPLHAARIAITMPCWQDECYPSHHTETLDPNITVHLDTISTLVYQDPSPGVGTLGSARILKAADPPRSIILSLVPGTRQSPDSTSLRRERAGVLCPIEELIYIYKAVSTNHCSRSFLVPLIVTGIKHGRTFDRNVLCFH